MHGLVHLLSDQAELFEICVNGKPDDILANEFTFQWKRGEILQNNINSIQVLRK